MSVRIKVREHYVIPESPHAGTIRTFDVARSGTALPSGNPEWIPVGISQKPTQLPEETHLGDVKRAVFSPFKKGWLITPAVPKNELWELFSQGMLGPTMDLLLPGTNVIVGSLLHGGIEAALEGNEAAKYLRRSLDGFYSLPYLDLVDIDWREAGTFWSLSMQGPVRHLSIAYVDAERKRSIITVAAGFTLESWVKQLLRYRYACEVQTEHQVVLDSFVEPGAYDALIASFNERHPENVTQQDVGDLVTAMAAVRTQHLLERGVTDEMVRTQSVERSLAILERYRGLPELDAFVREFTST
jgi:hypothetical protein